MKMVFEDAFFTLAIVGILVAFRSLNYFPNEQEIETDYFKKRG